LPPDGILPGAKFTLSPSVALSLLYWQHYCTVLEQQASAKLCGMVQGMDLRGTFAESAIYIRLGGHDVGHRPTF